MIEINLDRVVALLTARGVFAYVEQTGGGCATIYAGPTHHEPGWGDRYAACAGPGWFTGGQAPEGGPMFTGGRARLDDFVVGADDDGETTPTTPLHVGATTEEDVADLIAAQVALPDPMTQLNADQLDALGFDSTARGFRRVRPDTTAQPRTDTPGGDAR
jgi:hypothetical protein